MKFNLFRPHFSVGLSLLSLSILPIDLAANPQQLKQEQVPSIGSKAQYDFIQDSDINAFKQGLDFGSTEHAEFIQSELIASQSVYFSTQVPEGQYRVNLTLGSEYGESLNTIKAESRRLMVNQLALAKGQTQELSILLDVRTPNIAGKGQITIKDREKDDLNWDDKLTLEFSAGTVVKKLSISPVSDLPTIYLTGDSIVTDQDIEPWASWGQLFTQYLTPNVIVSNYAVSGASLHSFKQSRRLEKVLSVIKPGDYLFIQFAHNDEKRKGEGIGPWQSYTELLKEYVLAARDKGATPVLLTPVQRRFFEKDGKLKPTHGDYPAAVRAVAKTLKVELIDLTKLTTTLYESWGDNVSRQAFVQYPANTFPNQAKALKDNTHFNYFGANEIALCVIHGLVSNNNPLVAFIHKTAREYSPANPNLLKNWTVPMSPRFNTVKPDGS